MKKIAKISIILIIIGVPMFLLAQAPPHPWDSSVGGGETTNPIGGGAPIGEGLIILLGLAIGYASKKLTFLKNMLNH